MKKFGVGIVLHLWFCSALSALNHRDTLGHIVGTKFTAISDKKKELSEPGDKMTVLGTLSAMECSLQCLEKDICMSFNVCQETFQGRPVRCELFKRRAVHENLHPSPCSYYERESPCQNGGIYLDDEDRCQCVNGRVGLTCHRFCRDCTEAYLYRKDGVYSEERTIQPMGSATPFQVLCYYLGQKGSTVVAFRNGNPTEDFYQTWQAYKEGFGTVPWQSWIGNEKLHQITRQGDYTLMVYIKKPGTNEYSNVYYDQMRVGNERERYTLHLGRYRPGSFAGDSLTPVNDPMRNINSKPFSTFDNDVSNNCASTLRAGWWFAEDCTAANLNGPLASPTYPHMYWLYPYGNTSLTGAYMIIEAKSYYTHMP